MTNAELEAKLNDLQDQVNYIFGQLGPVRWSHILKQRADNVSNTYIDKKGHLTFKPQ
jgi:hypothetical protein